MRDVSHLSPDGQSRIARLKAALDPAFRNRLRGTLRDRVEGAWLALGGPACVENETDLEDAEIFLDELERLEEAGDADLEALAESLGQLYALPDVAAGDDAVEIMTIHKAKGLEFDSVILPGLDRTPRSGSRELLAWKTLPSGLLLAPIDETGAEEDPIYRHVRALEREAEDIEAGRLFYVAATRAKKHLHLLACAGCDKEGEIKQPPKRSLLARMWWQAQEHFGSVPETALEKPAREPFPDILHRLPADFALPAVPRSVALSVPDGVSSESEIEFSWVGETARHVGTVVHRWLQQISEDELRGWDAARVDALRKRFHDELHRRGLPLPEAQRSAETIATALKNALADERGRWILGPHPEARSEYRMRVRSDQGTRNYVMDRVFRDAGVLWIVDYKTSRHEGADVEAFLDRERERYASQLAAYAAVLQGSRQALYFPLLKGWRALSQKG